MLGIFKPRERQVDFARNNTNSIARFLSSYLICATSFAFWSSWKIKIYLISEAKFAFIHQLLWEELWRITWETLMQHTTELKTRKWDVPNNVRFRFRRLSQSVWKKKWIANLCSRMTCRQMHLTYIIWKRPKRQTGDQFCKNNERAKQINRGHPNGSRVLLL